VAHVAKKHDLGEGAIHAWRKGYEHLEINDVWLLRQLGHEDSRRKKAPPATADQVAAETRSA
jgi:hypothetical protein